ncbi:DUF6493 family protein [Bacteroides sp. 224]|uniref:DUF6493 family protein n=1 Tax=Bacteroides sp. 224 TaxID=2302936 RepID=UPI0013D43FB2|nr:DUF6493 family protein [Bacteroides sp. 224]NDV65777.1 hypothetical protein [Bacteroides sp. 224]
MIHKLILEQDYPAMVQWARTLTDEERAQSLNYLRTLDIDTIVDVPFPKEYSREFYDRRNTLNHTVRLMRMFCIRSYQELTKDIFSEWDKTYSVLHELFSYSVYATNEAKEALISYLKEFPIDQLDKIVAYWKNQRSKQMEFHLLWKLYKEGWVAFEEETFVRSLFIIPMSGRSVCKDLDFLEQHPEAIDKVLMQFYKYELPVLDISNWDAYGKFVSEKCTGYWDEIFYQLQEKGLITDRTIIRNLLETLNLNWKKGHIDWHIRLIKLFKPTTDEYLKNQDALWTALFATNNTVSNYVIQTVKDIYQQEGFDAEAFLQSVSPLLLKEKCDKGILLALDIIEQLLNKNAGLQPYISVVAEALVQPNAKIQVKAARLLKRYAEASALKNLIEPYQSTLKKEAREELQVDAVEELPEEIIPVLEHTPLLVPSTWEDLLFHLGKTMKSLTPADVDLFYEGVIQLQDQLPDGWQNQLKPYLKQAAKADIEKGLLVYLDEFLQNWVQPEKTYRQRANFNDERRKPDPFLRDRNKWVLAKLNGKSKLSLLSSPTHAPFYIHPAALLERLMNYEQQQHEVHLTDLIIACNRLLLNELTEKQKAQSLLLKGTYAQAVQYLFGADTDIVPNEETLPLWTQVARTRDVKGTFKTFESTTAGSYPTVVSPFCVSQEVIRRFSDDREWHWDMIVLQDNWNNNYWVKEEAHHYPFPFFYTAYNNDAHITDIRYCLSLIPHYIDAFMAKLTPIYSDEFDASDILQFLIENQLKMHHSGWIYIAACLVAQHKTTRLLAAEYLNLMTELEVADKEYFAACLANLLNKKFAPINRFMEYLDRSASPKVRELQRCILAECIRTAEDGNLPVNFKKLKAAYAELLAGNCLQK